MEKGQIVCFEELVFSDNVVDTKNNRPCIYLFEEQREDGDYVYVIPLTTQVKTFNKHSEKLVLVPDVIFNSNKLSFANLEGITAIKKELVSLLGTHVSSEFVDQLLEKIKTVNPRKKLEDNFNYALLLLDYIKLFDSLDDQEKPLTKKQLRRQRIREAKRR